MKRLAFAFAIVSCFSSTSLAQFPADAAPPVDDARDFIIFKDRAFVVGKPILVAGPTVAEPSWSPTGSYLVYEQVSGETSVLGVQEAVREQRAPVPERALCVYNLATGKSSEVVRFSSLQHPRLYWISGSDRALIDTQRVVFDEAGIPDQTDTLYMLDAAAGTIREYTPWEGDGALAYAMITPSPSQPYTLLDVHLTQLGFTPDGKREVTRERKSLLVAANGQSSPVQIPSDSGVLLLTAWSADGSKVYAMARPMGRERKTNWYSISLIDGTATPIDQPTQFYMGGAKGGVVTVRDVQQDTTNGKSRQALNALWLETVDPDSQNRLLLAGDASDGAVNQTVDCASYVAQGSLFVRPISEVPKKRYELAVIAWNRTKLLQQARQGGLALIMYASDYDDVLPNSKQNLFAILEPYMKDASLLSGFIYTYPGGPITSIDNPTTMEIGYVDASDGRAVVYADGHVKWVPKP